MSLIDYYELIKETSSSLDTYTISLKFISKFDYIHVVNSEEKLVKSLKLSLIRNEKSNTQLSASDARRTRTHYST